MDLLLGEVVLADLPGHLEHVAVGGLPAHGRAGPLVFLDELVEAGGALRQGDGGQLRAAAVADHLAHPLDHEGLGLDLVVDHLLEHPVVLGELDVREVRLDQRVVHLVLVGGVVADGLDGLGDCQAEHALLVGVEVQGLAVVRLGLTHGLDDGVRQDLLPTLEARVLVEGLRGGWRLGLAAGAVVGAGQGRGRAGQEEGNAAKQDGGQGGQGRVHGYPPR